MRIACRMFKKAVQRGRSERRGEADSLRYVEPLSDARTKQADFFNILLGRSRRRRDRTSPSPVLTITLTSGKTGEFLLGIAGSLKGELEFGQVELPANGLKEIVFK